MLPRRRHLDQCMNLLRAGPCVAIVGARQVGKTTLHGHLAGSGRMTRGWLAAEVVGVWTVCG